MVVKKVVYSLHTVSAERLWVFRSHPENFYKKGLFKNFAKFTGIHLDWSLFFKNVAG